MIHSVSHTSRYGAAGLYCILKSQNKKRGYTNSPFSHTEKKKREYIYNWKGKKVSGT